MLLALDGSTLVVTREPTDPRFKDGYPDARGVYAVTAESTFLYHVKKALLAHGLDVIKKRAWKDGNLVDDDMQYVRTRKWTGADAGEFAVYWSRGQIEDAGKVFNRDGTVSLSVMGDTSPLAAALGKGGRK